MSEKTVAEMSSQKFESLLDDMHGEDLGDLTVDQFFTGLSAVADSDTSPETVEVSAEVQDGQLRFLEPAPVPVRGNELQLGRQRLGVKLVA